MVENMGDDLWIGVKGQANSVIAGSPRNAFRCSVVCFLPEVEHATLHLNAFRVDPKPSELSMGRLKRG